MTMSWIRIKFVWRKIITAAIIPIAFAIVARIAITIIAIANAIVSCKRVRTLSTYKERFFRGQNGPLDIFYQLF